MKETPLTPVHLKLGARMAPFAGYYMPVVYTSIQEEHEAVRMRAGIFDVSHMGEFVFKGKGAKALIQRVTTNDVDRLSPGQAQYSCMTDENGGIIDDLLVYHLEDGNWMLVVNAANIGKDWNWIQSHNTEGVEAHNISDKTALIAVQGPLAARILQPLTGIDLMHMRYYTFKKGEFAGLNNILVSATGYTGSGGFEIYMDSGNAQHIWESVMAAGRDYGLQPAGLGARDTLRLEMGYCLYGNDIDQTTNPLEAGLGWITRFNKVFIGREALLRIKENGITRKLSGFEMLDRGIPRQGYPLCDESGREISKVTSGTFSPSLKKGIGLGYLPIEFAVPGKKIAVKIRNHLHPAVVVKPPFYKVHN